MTVVNESLKRSEVTFEPAEELGRQVFSKVSLFAPISIGNVSVGFDSLGLAVTPVDGKHLGDIVHVEFNSDNEDQLVCVGSFRASLPEKKEENIVWQCLAEFNQSLLDIQQEPIKVILTLEKNIPICSGLGSSACSVVAGFAALNEFYGNPFSREKLLRMMGKLEAVISGSLHYDNVAPCYLGGLQLMLGDDKKISQSIPIFENCYWVVAYPKISISTKAAREILPTEYDRNDLVAYGRYLAGFIDASYRQDKQQAFELLKDIVAEPYRIELLDNYSETKNELLNIGCLSVGISGSGPTAFAVCDTFEQAEKAQAVFQSSYIDAKGGFVSICKADMLGARKID